MVEPITLGVIVAALAAKALERAGDETVDAGARALRKVLQALRDRFSRELGDEGSLALERVADAPDSAERARALATQVDALPAEAKLELEQLVEEAREAGVAIEAISQTAVGDRNIQISGVANSEIVVEERSS